MVSEVGMCVGKVGLVGTKVVFEVMVARCGCESCWSCLPVGVRRESGQLLRCLVLSVSCPKPQVKDTSQR